jgi:hypothetical protein
LNEDEDEEDDEEEIEMYRDSMQRLKVNMLSELMIIEVIN